VAPLPGELTVTWLKPAIVNRTSKKTSLNAFLKLSTPVAFFGNRSGN
jgi:hypothetical protein